MSELPVISITNDDFFGKSVSTNPDTSDVEPKYFRWRHMGEFSDRDARFITDRHIKRFAGIGKIALLLEPNELHPENYIIAASARYDKVLSHHKDMVDRYENWFYYPYGGTHLKKEEWGLPVKKGGVSMFITKKNTTFGHKLRQKVYNEFPEVDYFGYGYNPVESKLDGLKDYPFQIVIESSSARGYFTEKIIDCFLTGTIPIYWGDPEIYEFFEAQGVIHWNGNLAELGLLLQSIAKNTWKIRKQMSHAVIANYQLAQKYVCAEDQIYKRYPELFV